MRHAILVAALLLASCVGAETDAEGWLDGRYNVGVFGSAQDAHNWLNRQAAEGRRFVAISTSGGQYFRITLVTEEATR